MNEIAQYVAADLNAFIIQNRPLLVALLVIILALLGMLVTRLSAWVHADSTEQGGEQ